MLQNCGSHYSEKLKSVEDEKNNGICVFHMFPSFSENGLFSPESQHNSICPSENSLDQSGMSNARLSDASLMWPSIMDHGTLDTSIHKITNSVSSL